MGDPGRTDVSATLETVAERPPAVATLATAGGTDTLGDDERPRSGGDSRSTVATPLETMRAEEAQQARVIIRLGRVFGLALLAGTPLFPDNRWLITVFAVALALAILVGIWVEREFKDPERYSEEKMMFVILPVWGAVYAAILYWGVNSAITVFAVLGVYFFCRRQNLAWALAMTLFAMVTHAALWAVVAFDVLPDPGIVKSTSSSLAYEVFGHLFIQAGYVGALLLGRSSHNATLASFEKLQRAHQLVSQREALLFEARQDLDQALQLGAAGRYSGRTFGTYKMGVVIGRGGMGEVYEAIHSDTGAIAAAKLLHVRALEDPKQVARFLREVRAVSGLNSPHVARVIEACDPTDAIPYFVMERLNGSDLAELLRTTRLLEPAGLDTLLRQVGALLDQVRKQGIVHRDLKPRNLFLADQPAGEAVWKVLDFGVATLSESTGTLTQGHVVGTPAYMAPEQARGDAVDHRADLYALAAIAYRWLTGRPAFSGREVPGLLYQVVHTMPTRPSKLAELHPQVDAALAIGLAKHATDRFDRASELADALHAALRGGLDPRLLARGTAVQDNTPWA